MNTFSRRSPQPNSTPGGNAAAGRGAVSPVQSLGAVLREQREAMGVTLAEVEVATRIRQKYLSAIESEEWHLLPGEVVGRGFLRNYADYLGLDPQEIMERRRATTDMGMTQALSTTSAGAPLPPERVVDYRPKEVELKDEGDGIQRGEIRLTPILAIIGVALVVGLGLWGLSALREPIGNMFAGVQSGVTGVFESSDAATPTSLAAGVVNAENVTQAQQAAMAATATASAQGVVVFGSGANTPDSAAPGNNGSDNSGAQAPTAPAEGGVILVPTATSPQVAVAPTVEAPTPVIEAPTATPEIPTATPVPPTPTLEPPTATPELLPTETPTPEPPAVVAASCADARAVISGPGVNQVLSGNATISGVATHEAFQFYKLEYAVGANAADGYTYFAGGQVQVSGGVLGNFNTTVLPNGEYTIRLTVVDREGNFPPPCSVPVVVQN